jgi:ribosomal protein S27E
VTASCPNCGDTQIIHAHHIIKVTGEKHLSNPPLWTAH